MKSSIPDHNRPPFSGRWLIPAMVTAFFMVWALANFFPFKPFPKHLFPVGHAVPTPSRTSLQFPLSPDLTTTTSLVIPAGQHHALLRITFSTPPNHLIGIRGDLETTGPARLLIQWPDGYQGLARAQLSGLNVELWAQPPTPERNQPPAKASSSTVILIARRNHPDDLTSPLAVGHNITALVAAGGEPVSEYWSGLFPGFSALILVLSIAFLSPAFRYMFRRPVKVTVFFNIVPLLPVFAFIALLMVFPEERLSYSNSGRYAQAEHFLLLVSLLSAALGLAYTTRIPLRRWPSGVFLGWATLLLLPAMIIRWQWLWDLRFVPLQADAMGYLEIAGSMINPFNAAYREPFFPLMLKVLGPGPGPLAARIVTFMFSIILGFVLLFALRPITPAWVLILVSLLYSYQILLAHSGALALREELVPLLILSVILAVDRAVRRNSLRVWRWAGILAGFMLLTRINTITVLIPMTVAALAWLWQTRNRDLTPRQWLQTIWGPLQFLGISLVLLAPNLWVMYRQYGDPLYASSKHATWYRNAEFAGQPGYITREEFLRDSYAGEQVSWGHYLFRMHTPVQLTSGTLAGLYGFTVGKPAQDALFRFSAERKVNTEYWTAQQPQGPQRWWEILLMTAAAMGWMRGLVFPGVALTVRMTAWALLLFLLPLAPLQGWGLLPDRLIFTCMPLYLVLMADLLGWFWNRLRRGEMPAPRLRRQRSFDSP